MLDQNNNFINFNGINWTMTLLINTHIRQTFSKSNVSILNDEYVAIKKTLKKPDKTAEEMEDILMI